MFTVTMVGVDAKGGPVHGSVSKDGTRYTVLVPVTGTVPTAQIEKNLKAGS